MSIQANFHFNKGEFTLKVEMQIPSQGITAVFGPSGAGKTTLLRAIAGLETHPGSLLTLDEEIWQDDHRNVPVHERSLGYVHQEPSLFPHLDVQENLDYGYRRARNSDRRPDRSAVMEWLGLTTLLERDTTTLSGGERQRVAMGRALLAGPRLLLMDEPLAALDQVSREEILPFLDRLHDELRIPILYVSHNREEVARLGDYLVLMEAGRIRAHGAMAELLTRLDLPLAQTRDAGAIVHARVKDYDDRWHLNWLEFSGGRLALSGPALPVDKPVRLGIHARDVSLTLEQQSDTSILNIIPCSVEQLAQGESGQCIVRLDAAGTILLAGITEKSATALELVPGKPVFAQVKSLALLT